jgi:RNA polymerase sigma factor (TIGR02999 family)
MEPPRLQSDITGFLHRWQRGDRQALDSLIPIVYEELRVIASRRLSREWRPGALQTTALVNEAYLKLVDQRRVDWQNRAHFFGLAAQLMRRILVDDARRRLQAKHGGGTVETPIDGLPLAAAAPDVDAVDALTLDRALRELQQIDEDQAKLVELRFFGGLTVEETAVVMGVSPRTVKREWAVARGWLHRVIGGNPHSGQ